METQSDAAIALELMKLIATERDEKTMRAGSGKEGERKYYLELYAECASAVAKVDKH